MDDKFLWAAGVGDVRGELEDDGAWAVLVVGFSASSRLLLAGLPESAVVQAFATKGGGRRRMVGMFLSRGCWDP